VYNPFEVCYLINPFPTTYEKTKNIQNNIGIERDIKAKKKIRKT